MRAALAVAALLVLAACAPEPQDRDVAVLENGVVLGHLDRARAIDDVSRRVGFEVLLPTRLPDNALRLVSVEALTPVSFIEATGSDGRSNARAVVAWESKDDALRIEQIDRRIEPPTGAAVESGRADSQLFVSRDGQGAIATWLSPDRAFVASFRGQPPTAAEFAAMFRSLRGGRVGLSLRGPLLHWNQTA